MTKQVTTFSVYDSHCPVCGGRIRVGTPIARRNAYSIAQQSMALLWGHTNCRPVIASETAMLRYQIVTGEGIPLHMTTLVNERPIFMGGRDEKGRKQGRHNVSVFYNNFTLKAILIDSQGDVFVPREKGWKQISREEALLIIKERE